MCVYIHTVKMWQVTLLLLLCVVWLQSWHYKDPPPQHTFSCSTPVGFSKPCSVITVFSTQSVSRQSQPLLFSKSCPSSLAYVALGVIPSSLQPRISKMPHISVESEGVKKLLSSFNPNKAAGPDCILSRVIDPFFSACETALLGQYCSRSTFAHIYQPIHKQLSSQPAILTPVFSVCMC